MCKRKKKKNCVRMGSQTPQYTPPPMPPVDPPREFAILYRLENNELENWVKTQAKIGDIAYCRDSSDEMAYIYHYLKPDNNPVWTVISLKENTND